MAARRHSDEQSKLREERSLDQGAIHDWWEGTQWDDDDEMNFLCELDDDYDPRLDSSCDQDEPEVSDATCSDSDDDAAAAESAEQPRDATA